MTDFEIYVIIFYAMAIASHIYSVWVDLLLEPDRVGEVHLFTIFL